MLTTCWLYFNGLRDELSSFMTIPLAIVNEVSRVEAHQRLPGIWQSILSSTQFHSISPIVPAKHKVVIWRLQVKLFADNETLMKWPWPGVFGNAWNVINKIMLQGMQECFYSRAKYVLCVPITVDAAFWELPRYMFIKSSIFVHYPLPQVAHIHRRNVSRKSQR